MCPAAQGIPREAWDRGNLKQNQAEKKTGGGNLAASTSRGGWGCRWTVFWALQDSRVRSSDPAKSPESTNGDADSTREESVST